MKRLRHLALGLILILSLTTGAFSAEVPENLVVENLNGQQRMVKTYVLSPEADPDTLKEPSFDYDGFHYHALIPAAAKAWGLPVEGCSASEPQRIVDALGKGKLVVALMTKGHFTSSGHFIVLRGVENEQILVADPASTTRSQKAWDLSIILNEASKSAAAGGHFWIVG